ncbi:MAG: hypothetical protein OXG34_16500 [bacterium]|nr:hypothetical protein [bacterium]
MGKSWIFAVAALIAGLLVWAVPSSAGPAHVSGPIPGPDYCTSLSLGGPRTYAFDSNGDGIADTCSLRDTRRATVARQNALETLAGLNPVEFRTAVLEECEDEDFLEIKFGDSAADLENDVCATERVSSPPPPVDPAIAATFFSGVIDGPHFCTNRSLGGARTYPFDSPPRDGAADTCSLPYTRREAVARQRGLEAAFAEHPQFKNALAYACAVLGSIDFGDKEEHLAVDACNPPPGPSDLGQPLPTATN